MLGVERVRSKLSQGAWQHDAAARGNPLTQLCGCYARGARDLSLQLVGMLRLRVANHHSATVRADPPIFAEDEAAVAEAYAALPRLGGGQAPVRPLAKSIRFVQWPMSCTFAQIPR